MRDKMKDKYKNEREELCKKIIEILDLKNGEIILHDLEKDIEKQEKLMALKIEIQKFFEVSTISTFKPNFECKRPYLNLVRSILRKQGYNFEGQNLMMKIEDGIYKTTMKYKISKKNIV